jgi:Sel1 repeat-containing protein
MTSRVSVALAAVCACCIAISAAAPAAGQPATQDDGPDQEAKTLLLKVVHQIVAGRAVLPLDDNALGTWEEVRKRAQEPTPAITRALEDFIKLSESQAATERTAGREMVAFDLQAFSGMAEELLQRGAGAPTVDRQSAGQAAPAATAPVLPSDVAPPPVEPAAAPVRPAKDAAVAVATPVAPPPVDPAAAPVKLPASDAALASTTPVAPPPRQSPPTEGRMAATFTDRGDAMLAIKDISAARKLYEEAVNLGSAAAARRLARTYDPGYVGELGIIGMRPDPAMAVSWYNRAAALGDHEAAQRVQEFGATLPARTTP